MRTLKLSCEPLVTGCCASQPVTSTINVPAIDELDFLEAF